MKADLTIHDNRVPLRKDESGAIRVGDSRVLFHLVVDAFKAGDDPERIVRDFTTLDLADVYAVIGYYLRHRDEVDEYLRALDAEAEEKRRSLEALHAEAGRPNLRELISERRAKLESQHGSPRE